MTETPQDRHDLVLQFFANAAAAVRAYPQQHRTWIMERCPWFDYMIQGDDRPLPKVFFFGKKSHAYGDTGGQKSLQGFSSDSISMIDLFRKETQLCRKAVGPDLKKGYPESLIDYWTQLFAPYGKGKAFRVLIDQAD